MKNNRLPLNFSRSFLSIIITLGMGLISTSLFAADEVEFDPRFLKTIGKSTIDVRRFSHGNPIPAGQYYADVYLNSEWKGRINLRYSDIGDAKGTDLCISPELLSIMDLVKEAMTVTKQSQNDTCHLASESIPSAKMHFDLSTLRLTIEIPQAMIIARPRGYIAPAQWQTGVPAGFINYDANYYQYKTADTAENNQTYLGIKAGLNFAGWAFRHRGSESWNNSHNSGYQNIETNIMHDVTTLRAQLTLGDFYTSGELMDSLSLRGIRLASDDRMLPNSLRGYAPTVRGIANSNAKVTIRQNGNILYETVVPAGPFVINDLYPSGYAGDLNVTITESNGQNRTFDVPFASVAQLIRPEYSRWQISAGRYRYTNKTLNDLVAQGTFQYGLTNDITLNSGITVAPHYSAGLAGAAFNTPIGAIASDITFSRTTFTNSDVTRKGYSLHTSYSVNVPTTSTNITLAAYRYSSKDFYNLKDAISANHSDFIDDASIKSAAFYRPKNQYQLSVNQNLGKEWGNIYLTGSTYNYWGRQGSRHEYQMGYSNFWKRLNYQVGFSQSRDNENQQLDDRVYLNLSLPLGNDIQSPLLSSTFNYNKSGNNTLQTSISGVTGEDNQFSYGISGNTQESGPSGYSVNGGYRSPFVNLMATTGRDSAHNRQASIAASGAIVAHPYGITLSNDLSDTFTIIHAKGAQGAIINNAPGSRLDYWGNGIVPYVTPYAKNHISIDPSHLPMNVELSATEQEIIPRANSATLVTFNTQIGHAILFDIKKSNGDTPPMAAEVFDEQEHLVGYVAQGGRFFARGLPEEGRLRVVWGIGHNNQCAFTYKVSTPTELSIDRPSIHSALCTTANDNAYPQ